jgi:hypothetical protein
MSDLTYHLESENRNHKNYLVVHLRSPTKKIATKEGLISLAATSSEKSALEFLVKELGKLPISERISVVPERAFTALKLLGTTGRLFFQGKKVVVDPFTTVDFHFIAERQDQETALITGSLQESEWVFVGDPSFVLKNGIIRSIQDIGSKWIRAAMAGPQLLKGLVLSEFLSDAEGEVAIIWKSGEAAVAIDPMPFLMLSDRHGGFADLWFDYGAYGKIPFHDAATPPWRNVPAEKGWEKDLLETDFRPKIVDKSHYYCPLDKVAKSLTFLLEIGWTLIDSCNRKVVRQKQTDFDAEFGEEKILIRAKVHYEAHQVDVKDLVGAFNRREHFVELSPTTVALFDREDFSSQWGDFTEQEITSEGIVVRKNHFGLLQPLLDQTAIPVREDLRQKIQKMARCEPVIAIEPGKGFLGTLFSYHKEGLQWLKFLQEGGFGGLLADEMGLGKTVQVLAFFSQLQMHRPCLIVVPTSLLFNW